MSDDADRFEELDALLLGKLADDELSDEDVGWLDEILKSDPRARQRYRRISTLQALLRWRAGGIRLPIEDDARADLEFDNPDAALHDDPVQSDVDALRSSSAMILPAIRETPDEQPLTVAPMQPPPKQNDSPPLPNARRWWRWVTAAAAAVLLVGIAAAVLVRILHPPVATLAQVLVVKWGNGSAGPASPDLRAGEQFALESGVCRLQFKDGTQLIAEGPAHFTVEAQNAVSLEDGSLTARMAGGSSGFIIRTPTATVTDLGTEFGVRFEPNRSETDVQVFQGTVQIATNANNQPHTLDLVAGGRADIVSDGKILIDQDGAQPQMFVRRTDESIQLLSVPDLVSGGDGTTHRTGGMIEPTTGETGTMITIKNRARDRGYHRITSIPVLDGCFVPDQGEMQVDSGGSRFKFAQPGGMAVDRIVAGGLFPWSPSAKPVHGRLGGINYSVAPHDLLFLHPDCGLTFNLDAIRRLHPAERLDAFRAVFGNGSDPPKTGKAWPELQILVDGMLRYEHVITSPQDINQFDVPLTDHDHFVTIAVTRTTPLLYNQYVLLGDPVFALSNR
jgi:hypothetical protein